MAKEFQSSPVGHEISAVFHGVGKKFLIDGKHIKKVLLDGLNIDKFGIISIASHDFKPKGHSTAVLLSESHTSIHTYPEHDSLTFHIYSCRRPGDGKKTFEHLKKTLNPEFIDFKERNVIVSRNHL